MTSHAGDGPPRSLLIAALVVAVGAVAAVLVVAAVLQRPSGPVPVAVSGVPAPHADSRQCAELVDGLPDRLGEYHRAPLVDPAPPGAAAWQPEDGGEPIILRCGLDRPVEFVAGTPVQVVDAVQWFRVEDRAGDDRATWFTVDRPVYVALTLPPGSGPDPIQTLSRTIARVLPATPVDPGPIR